VRKGSGVVGLAIADLHLRHTPPVSRSAERNWYVAMERYINRLHEIHEQYGKPPIFCAGDVFDNWRVPLELVNWALRSLPPMYAVPGQHELPNHRYEGMSKSPYWTMVHAGRIENLEPGILMSIAPRVKAVGFPFGYPLQPLKSFGIDPDDHTIYIAVAHRYIWRSGKCYPGARPDEHIRVAKTILQDYNFSIFGDNHKGFSHRERHDLQSSFRMIINCGCFMRQSIDEKDDTPVVHVLQSDGRFHVEPLGVEERWIDVDQVDTIIKNITGLEGGTELIEAMRKMGDAALDWVQALDRHLETKGVDLSIRKLVNEWKGA
jgi:hypothetical protein